MNHERTVSADAYCLRGAGPNTLATASRIPLRLVPGDSVRVFNRNNLAVRYETREVMSVRSWCLV